MKIVKFLGGIGNQMFQYAFYRTLKENFPVVKADIAGFSNYTLHNGLELERVFPIKLDRSANFENYLYGEMHTDLLSKIRRKTYGKWKSYYKEKQFSYFDPNILTDPENRYYWGYWQNERYFKSIEQQLRNDFTFKNELASRNKEMLQEMLKTNSISVHVRRGDYNNHPILGNICDLDYYKKAIGIISEKIANPVIYTFSNDIQWCKENLAFAHAKYIDWNNDQDSYIDMQLMSNCKHNIIANSSFSWWAAWLNTNENKTVLAPSRWFNEENFDINTIIPPEWEKV
jgi:hypothetical protein